MAELDADAVRAAWDAAAEGYARGQRDGLDYYRYMFFGPAQRAVVGDVAGKRLLDVGCGAGYFARLMAGARADVTAIDVSPRMIDQARAAGGEITYRTVDAAALAEAFAPGSFEIATSCVALSDMADPAAALRAVHAVLAPGGRFVATIEHPCSNPPLRRWERDANGDKRWLCIDRYFERTTRTFTWERWPTGFTTSATHAPLEDWFRWILEAGFALRGFHEPVPTDDAIRAQPGLADAARVPYFAMFDLVR